MGLPLLDDGVYLGIVVIIAAVFRLPPQCGCCVASVVSNDDVGFSQGYDLHTMASLPFYHSCHPGTDHRLLPVPAGMAVACFDIQMQNDFASHTDHRFSSMLGTCRVDA